MAKWENLALLAQGVEAWNQWRREHRDAITDLGEADLSRADFTAADFHDTDFIRANLSRARLVRADLTAANLIYANLSAADLESANLDHAHCSGANFSAARLSQVKLGGAKLIMTDFTGADLSKADLKGANLTMANLNGANLSGADLEGADLTDTELVGTVFADTRLAEVRGLETCRHLGPCDIDHRTLEHSGDLSLAFLRGCGLPGSAFRERPGLTTNTARFYRCFISYSPIDKVFAWRLFERLQERGVCCWLDEHPLQPNEARAIGVAAEPNDKILLCCSTASLTSWWIEDHVRAALEKERKLEAAGHRAVHTLIALSLDDFLTRGQWHGTRQEHIQSRLYADFIGWQEDEAKFSEAFERLVHGLHTSGEKAPASA